MGVEASACASISALLCFTSGGRVLCSSATRRGSVGQSVGVLVTPQNGMITSHRGRNIPIPYCTFSVNYTLSVPISLWTRVRVRQPQRQEDVFVMNGSSATVVHCPNGRFLETHSLTFVHWETVARQTLWQHWLCLNFVSQEMLQLSLSM